jgi:TPR repeat protein
MKETFIQKLFAAKKGDGKADYLEKAKDAQNKGNDSAAKKYFKHAADLGNAEAQFEYAELVMNGARNERSAMEALE